MAIAAAQGGQGGDAALASEAFGGHYLTDSFSAGHIRSPRFDVKG